MTDRTARKHFNRKLMDVDITAREKLWPAFRALCCLFSAPIGAGSHRVVWQDGWEVIKMDITKGANARELRGATSQRYVGRRRDPGRIPMEARARCWKDDKLSALCNALIIRMELVQDPPKRMLMPPWVTMVDNGQVGLTRDGRLVAYDYAD